MQPSSTVSSEPESYVSMTRSPVAFVPKKSPNIFEKPPKVFPFRPVEILNVEPAVIDDRLIHLDLEHLTCFEVVDHQFSRSGIIFNNAIALKPSNPLFPTGQTVLMGAPQSGMIEATFAQPIRFVSALLTGSRRTVMTAFNEKNTIIAKAEIPRATLAKPGSSGLPHQPTTLCAQAIHRISIRSIGGQFTMNDVAFSH